MLLTSIDQILCRDMGAETNAEGIRVHGLRLVRNVDILAALERDVFTADVNKVKVGFKGKLFLG